jgi:hypothetical protein
VIDDRTAIEEKIDKILQSLDQQIRGSEQTLSNLKSLLDPVDQPAREKCLDHLFRLLVNRIRSNSGSDQNTRLRQQQSISILFKILFEYGRVETTLCKIIGFLDVDSSDVTNNWRDFVSHEITSAVYGYSNVLSQNALDVLKEHAALFSNRGNDLARAMPAFLPYVSNLKRAIENAEFSRFEEQIRVRPAAAFHSETDPQVVPKALTPTIESALQEASDYLRNDGKFSPKKAADLLRSSIEESHREILKRLVEQTGSPYTGGEMDGKRREYFRTVGFISKPEEDFFSAIYTLLSQEASHKLIAPRETVLVMEQTVRAYLALLVRRLDQSNAPQLKVGP